MCEFSRSDVITVAKAVLDEWCMYNDRAFGPYYYCLYCDAKFSGHEAALNDFKHNLTCPVLVAQDILTGQTGPPAPKVLSHERTVKRKVLMRI